MGGHGRARLVVPSRLQDGQRLAGGPQRPCPLDEAGGIPEPLQEQCDRSCLIVMREVPEVIPHRRDRFVAARDESGETDPRSHVHRGLDHGAALRHQRHLSGQKARWDRSDVQGDGASRRDHAHAVRPAHGHVEIATDARDLLMDRKGRVARLGESASRHHGRPRSALRCRPEDVRHLFDANGGHHRVQPAGHLIE